MSHRFDLVKNNILSDSFNASALLKMSITVKVNGLCNIMQSVCIEAKCLETNGINVNL